MALEGSGTTLTSLTRTTIRGKQTRLRAMANTALGAVADALQRTSQDIIKKLQEYPPPPAPSAHRTYERTGELGVHWKTFPASGAAPNLDGSMSLAIYNDVVDQYGRYYAIYVQGQWQTDAHAETGWSRLEDVAKKYSTAQGNRVRASINRAGRL